MRAVRGLLIILVLGIVPAVAHAGEWSKTYGGNGFDSAGHILQTADGGYIAAGSTSSFGSGKLDAWVVKLDADGNIQWQKAYGGSGDDGTGIIQQLTDGGFVIAGTSASFNGLNTDIWILKLDVVGNILWQKIYVDVERLGSLQQTTDGGFIVSGTLEAPPGPGILMLKLDKEGNIEWQKNYGVGGQRIAHGGVARQTSDGGFIVAGSVNVAFISFSGISTAAGLEATEGICLLKLDAIGNIQWQKLYGNVVGQPSDIQQTADGGFVIAGIIYSGTTNLSGDAWVVKFAPAGTIEWQKRYGGNRADGANAIYQTPGGGYVVSGVLTENSPIQSDAWLFKLSAGGNLEWQKTFGGTGNDGGIVAQSKDGGLILGDGSTSFGSGFSDVWITILDSAGNMTVPGCTIMKQSDIFVATTNVTPTPMNTTVQSSTLGARPTNATVTEKTVSPAGVCVDGTMPAPVGANLFSGSPRNSASFDPNPAAAQPLGFGSVAYVPAPGFSTLNVQVGLLSLSGAVDIYIGIYAPSISPELWLVKQDNTLQPISAGLAKWKENTLGPVNEALFGTIQASSLPTGRYDFYLGVTPAGTLDAFYLWNSYFEKR